MISLQGCFEITGELTMLSGLFNFEEFVLGECFLVVAHYLLIQVADGVIFTII
jgi:hypothetical protein